MATDREGKNNTPTKDIPDEWVDLASDLLSYFHAEEEVRKKIIRKAFLRLPVVAKAQRRRVYGHPDQPKQNYLKDLHNLQLLLLMYSDEEQQEQEKGGSALPSDEDWTRRLMAYITIASLKSSSFAAIGWGCIIHDYHPIEAHGLHKSLLDDKDAHPSDENFRTKKSSMMKDAKQRFPNLCVKGAPRGEESHFIRRKDQDDPSLRQLVEEFRDILKPWKLPCPSAQDAKAPKNFSMHKLFRMHEEYGYRETRRVHRFICPACFRALTKGAADSRLGIPQFFSEPCPDGAPSGGDGDSQNSQTSS